MESVFKSAARNVQNKNGGNKYTDQRGRHTGYFSENNPYFGQLRITRDKQDIDALYERAIEWEADYANRQMQLEENRAILEEQREYDLPINEVARQRAAGINPDIAGSGSGSGSGSDAQLTNPGMADQQGQTKFGNYYDNANLVLSGISTAVNFVSGLSSGVSGILNAVSNFKLVPSQIALNEANAGLANAEANQINTLLDGKKQNLDLTNSGLEISNAANKFSLASSLAEKISPDTEDIPAEILKLGVSGDDATEYSDLVKLFHAHPALKAQFAADKTKQTWNEAENAEFTREMVSQIVDLEGSTRLHKSWSDFYVSKMDDAFNNFLDNVGFGTKSADYENRELSLGFKELSYDRQALDYAIEKLKNDVGA